MCRDIAHNTAASILRPGADGEIDLRAVDDGLPVEEGGMDLHIFLAPVLVGDVDGKGVFRLTVFCRNGEGVLAGLAVFQQKRHGIPAFQPYRAPGAGLIALNLRDLHALHRRAGQHHLEGKESTTELIIIDGFSRPGLSVFA